MRKISILFPLLFSITLASSQNKNRQLVLIVDTIEQSKAYLLDGFSPSVNFGGFANLPKEIETEKFSIKIFPNFISKKIILYDTSTITIPISKSGDIIEIKGFQKIKGDTIRINKLPVIQNNFADTTFTTKYWFLEKNDSLLPLPDKSEKFISIVNNKNSKQTNSINLIINRKQYSTSLNNTKGQSIITTGTGTKPVNPYKKDGTRKKSVMRFNVNSETKKWIYKGTILLSPN